MKNIIVGTAGHIDHGKSSLIKALTGIDPDRLKEEKQRGISIDIGFASLDLNANVHLGFVDVPGHERFIKNMLAGVGGIDAVLLVVAADESIMPQTREHFEICRLLNIRTGVVAITKADLADQDGVDLVRLELEDYLRGSFLDGAPIIPVSAQTGAGLEPIKAALLEIAEAVPSRKADAAFRLPIDRCFSVHGHGTIVTGTLTSGSLEKDAEIEIYPAGIVARVRNLEVHSRPVALAVAGQRTAINLPNIEVSQIERGMQLSAVGRFKPAVLFDASLTLLEDAPVGLRPQTQVRFHQGTAECLARIRPLCSAELSPGQSGYVRIRLPHPVLVLPGDRFIVRRASPMQTLGGGVVLDIDPPKKRRGMADPAAFLKIAEAADLKQICLALVARAGQSGVEEKHLLSQSGAGRGEILEMLEELSRQGAIKWLSRNPWQIMETSAFEQLLQATVQTLAAFHKQNPLQAGLSKEQLGSSVFSHVPAAAFRGVLDQLAQRGEIVIEKELIHLKGQAIKLDSREVTAKSKIEEAFHQAGWQVPSMDEVLRTVGLPLAQARQLAVLLAKEKKLLKVAEGLYFHSDAIAELKRRLASQKQKSEKIDVAQFKTLTGVSRKYAIPLLEYLDREKVTQRQGEYRIIL
jgi:selenocysteine-specific elongation factor